MSTPHDPHPSSSPYGSGAGAPYTQVPYGPAPAYRVVTAEDPGQTFGIIAFVLAFVCPIAGIVLGIMSRNKSREVGLPFSALGKWGLILSIIFVSLGVLFVLAYVVIVFVILGLFGAVAAGTSESLAIVSALA